MLGRHLSWQAKHLVMLADHLSRQAQQLVMSQRPLSCQAQHVVMLVCSFFVASETFGDVAVLLCPSRHTIGDVGTRLSVASATFVMSECHFRWQTHQLIMLQAAATFADVAVPLLLACGNIRSCWITTFFFARPFFPPLPLALTVVLGSLQAHDWHEGQSPGPRFSRNVGEIDWRKEGPAGLPPRVGSS